MKTLKFFSIALVSSLLMVSSVFASGGDKSNADVKAAENSIREQLAGVLSEVAVDNSDVVYVYFTVSAKNGFELNAVSSLNSSLSDQVKKTLTSKVIAAPANLDGKYLLKIRFIDRASL
jgi:hypothetical protein